MVDAVAEMNIGNGIREAIVEAEGSRVFFRTGDFLERTEAEIPFVDDTQEDVIKILNEEKNRKELYLILHIYQPDGVPDRVVSIRPVSMGKYGGSENDYRHEMLTLRDPVMNDKYFTVIRRDF